MHDQTTVLSDQVRAAFHAGTPLAIRGGDSKAFYGRASDGEPLDVSGHHGVVNHEPSELVITARAGTPLAEVEATLAEAGQMLPFEPPRFGGGGTVGGAIATGLSGPRRPWTGAVRDFLLGTRIINGRGEVLRLGGEVIKNVAGYDLSRLMAGALGTLGVVLEASFKVLPAPQTEITLARACSAVNALELFEDWASEALPISGACHLEEMLFVRLSGSEAAVSSAQSRIGGDPVADNSLWRDLCDHRHPFFAGDLPLWRLSIPANASLALPDGVWFIDWGGAQRWLRSDLPAAKVRAHAESAGGHAVLFRHGDRRQAFQAPGDGLMSLHRRLKTALDPRGILNPGRLYPGL